MNESQFAVAVGIATTLVPPPGFILRSHSKAGWLTSATYYSNWTSHNLGGRPFDTEDPRVPRFGRGTLKIAPAQLSKYLDTQVEYVCICAYIAVSYQLTKLLPCDGSNNPSVVAIMYEKSRHPLECKFGSRPIQRPNGLIDSASRNLTFIYATGDNGKAAFDDIGSTANVAPMRLPILAEGIQYLPHAILFKFIEIPISGVNPHARTIWKSLESWNVHHLGHSTVTF